MRYLKTYKIFESNKDAYHDLMMVLNDFFDEWKIISYSNERFGDDNGDYPEHKFWAFRDNTGDIMTKDIDSIKDVKDMVIYNIPVDEEDEDKFKNEVLSYKEQIEAVTGKTFFIKEEPINSIYSDYRLWLV